MDLSLSPDGRFAAFDKQLGTGVGIWIMKLEDGASTRFTLGSKGQIFSNPTWSPDGRRIAYSFRNVELYVKDANGTGTEELASSRLGLPLSWSADGANLLSAGRNRLFLFSLKTKERVPIGPETGVFPDAKLSPDGRYVAFSSAESGRVEVYVQALPPGSGKWQISLSGGTQPRWRKDGKELFFVSTDRKLVAATIQGETGAIAGTPHVLFPLATRVGTDQSYDVRPTGSVS
jgi:Tol biopolymer transport system component